MPFQSEKQRRFLHANHPEIAKRWEREYATGGISNHFRKKFFTGALADTQGPAGGQAMSPGTSTTGGSRNLGGGQGNQGNQGGGGGPKPHSGPSFAEIEAQKKIELAKQKAHDDAKHVAWLNQQRENRKEKVKRFKKLVDTKGYYSDKATDEEKKLHDDWLIATGQKEKMTHPVLLNSEHLADIRGEGIGEDIKTKAFHKMNSSVEDLITGDINRENIIVTPELGYIGTHMGPTGIQVQTGGDKYGTIENLPLSATQSWAVNPGKPREYDFSDIQGHQAGLTKKQKQALQGSQKNLKNIMGISNEEILENIKMWDNPDDPATVKDIETFYSAKGGVARKNYFHGGILDINESEEIISDDGNDIELTAYNAAFDEPTGVKSLFQAKDGGRIGFANGPPGGGETSLGSGAAYSGGASDRGPRDDPDRHGPVSTPKTVPSGINIHGGPTVKEALRAGELKKMALDFEEEKGGPEYYGLRDLQNKQKKLQIKIQDKITGDWKRYMDPSTWEKVKNVYAFTSISGAIKEIFKGIKRSKDMRAFLKDLEAIGLAGGPPGTNDPLYDELWLHLEKMDPKYKKDDTGESDGPEPIYAPLTGAVGEEYAQGYYGMSDLERIRAGQATYAGLQDRWEREKAMFANSGGLANLFRVKNQ